MKSWASLSLRGRLFLLALLPLLASLALIAFAVRQQERELAAREQALVRASYMDARRTELRHYVDLAVSTLKPLLGQPGGPQRALQLLSSLDYGPDGYFFVYDLQGRVLMHSRQAELVGQNLWELRDPQGRPTIQQLIAKAKAGGGYVEYLWRKPSSNLLAPKLGYVVAVPEWNWMLGTGLYLDGIEATMAELERGARQNITTTLLWVGAVAVFGVALISAGALALNLSEHRSAEAKLRALAREVVQSQEDERARLARELHDGVSQALVATKLLIESAQHEPGGAGRLQALALKQLNGTLAEVRHISHALRPALLDTLGLPAALQHLAGEFDAAGGAHFEAGIEGEEAELPEAVKTALFRIAQEALNNAARHARATAVRVALRFEPRGGLVLEVADDGRGFDADAAQAVADRGLGLRSMRERADALGARLSLATAPGQGCRLAVKLGPAEAMTMGREGLQPGANQGAARRPHSRAGQRRNAEWPLAAGLPEGLCPVRPRAALQILAGYPTRLRFAPCSQPDWAQRDPLPWLQQAPHRPRPCPRMTPIRILLVDDHPMVREGLVARLQAVPRFEVVGEAGGRADALALLASARPDVVLMDVGLKDGNGIALGAEMLAAQPAIRLLMFSMYDNPEYVQRALQAGARGYVLKDAPATEIVSAIDAVAAGGTFLSAAVSGRLFRGQAPKPVLTPRESEILAKLGQGASSKQIARELDLSVRTVEAHRQSIKRKLELEGQAELIRYAVEHAQR